MNERMKFLVDEVNLLTKKKKEMKMKNIPLWNWPNEEGKLMEMYVDEIKELKQEGLQMDTIKSEVELVNVFIDRLEERENKKEEEMMKKRNAIGFTKVEKMETEKEFDKIPNEIELLNQLINHETKEEEMEIMKEEEVENIRVEETERQKEHVQREAEVADKEIEVWAQEVSSNPVFGKKKDNLVYNKKDKVWMEEGAVFRQISQKGFYNEIKRIREVFSKLSIARGARVINVAEKYIFNNREVFVKLFNNMKKGGYVITRKDENSITLGKEWYSFGMRSNYYHSVQFSKSKDGEYVIGDIRDRRILKDYSKKRKYGRKYLPITRVGL